MANEFHREFAEHQRAVVVAPAGCGKTELITRAVGCSDNARQLVLTHTHAGVKSLKDRLKKLGVRSNLFSVETIASFALRYARSFPETASFRIEYPQNHDEYIATYHAAEKVLSTHFGKAIIRQTYAGLYVDEYQDCTVRQHRLILALAQELPCRIVGDPLQGIFDFNKNDPLIDWNDDVFANFERLSDLNVPYRWEGKNPELGTWLMGIRNNLISGDAFTLDNAPDGVEWQELDAANNNQRDACFKMANDRGNRDKSIVVIHRLANQAHKLAQGLRGIYKSMEEIDCSDLFNGTERLLSNTGTQRALEIIKFAQRCITKVSTELKITKTRIENGHPLPGQIRNFRNVAIALQNVINDTSVERILEVLTCIERETKGHIYREELWGEMKKALVEYSSGKFETIRDAAWHIRQQYRVVGRRVPKRCVTRTLLIKGLEFDCAVVANADILSTKELYVAMTRASTKMTILSSNVNIRKAAHPIP